MTTSLPRQDQSVGRSSCFVTKRLTVRRRCWFFRAKSSRIRYCAAGALSHFRPCPVNRLPRLGDRSPVGLHDRANATQQRHRLCAKRTTGSRTFVEFVPASRCATEDSQKGRCRFFSCPIIGGPTIPTDRCGWSLAMPPSAKSIARSRALWKYRARSGTASSGWSTMLTPRLMSRPGWARIWIRSWPATTSTSWRASGAAGFDEPTNWKIMQDAFLDGYHIQYAPLPIPRERSSIPTSWRSRTSVGIAGFIAPRKSIDRWLEEDPGDRWLDRYVTETHFLLPNSTLLRQPDHFQLLTFRPIRATRPSPGWSNG